jgi:S-DNA-T family DNA segregation ATPase FtsK/SpoIIIE
MLEQRNSKLDLLAIALLALLVFAGLSLVSYHRADPVGFGGTASLVYPVNEDVANICGRGGAWLADRLLRGLGIGAYYMVLSLAVLDGLLLMRRRIPQATIRIFGWMVSLAGLSTLAAMAVPTLCPSLWAGPEMGAGGFLGAAGHGLLESHFAVAGAYILTVSLILGGLLMSTDYLVLQVAHWCIGKPLAATMRVGQAAVRRRSGADAAEGEDNDEADATGDDSNLSVRILGRRVEPAAATSEADAADDEEANEVEDEDVADEAAEEDSADENDDATEPAEIEAEAPAKQGLGQRIAAALRIKPNGRKADRDKVIEELDAAVETAELPEYELPDINLLLPPEQFQYDEQEKEVRKKAKVLEKTFANFGFNVKVVEIETGPVIAQFEVELEAGLRLSKITGLADDLAIALRVPSVRIVAPIPGKNTVGIEVPNTMRQLVRLREVMEEDTVKTRKMKVPIFLGKDVAGNPLTCDLASLPHLLIAGRTGTGKSVCLNSIIVSMIMTRRPDEVRMLMIDPKMVELSPYKSLPHLMHPVVTDMKKAEAILGWTVEKMEERYALLARAGVRHISVYNQLGEEELMERIKPESEEERQSIPLHLPYIVCIADEIADLMMTAPKEVESHIIRLAQKSRAVGIHLVLATQKPTVDVITGLIKSNLPARICFQVASRVDSRVVLDEMGADKLLGNGDMLFLWPGTSTLLRGQGTFLSDDEITKVIGAVATTEPDYVGELVHLQPAGAAGEGGGANKFKNRDEMYEAAIDVIVREGRGSVSLLQRALGIGYGRGARLIDFMAEDGIVGAYNGSQAREVLVTPEQWAQMQAEANGTAPPAALAPPAQRRNKIEVQPRRPSPLEEEDAEFISADEVAAAAKKRRTVRPVVEEIEDDDDEASPDDDAEYGVLAPVEINRDEEEEDDADDEEGAEVDEDELEEDAGALDDDDQYVSEWHEDSKDGSDEETEDADDDAEAEEYAELDE